MADIVDLTMPIEDHFRWKLDRDLVGDFDKGDNFQITRLGWVVHGFTHVDAPRHILAEGATTEDLGLGRFVGEAVVLDLTGIAPNSEITAAMLEPFAAKVKPGDIAVIKTCWDRVCSYRTPAFWTEAPYFSAEAARWLLDREVKAVAFDFPQDFPIRLLLKGETRPMAEFVTHDVLLRNGVVLIEYICNTAALTRERTTVFALPLKVPQADGAPARVIAYN